MIPAWKLELASPKDAEDAMMTEGERMVFGGGVQTRSELDVLH
jgi:hypothetical protein